MYFHGMGEKNVHDLLSLWMDYHDPELPQYFQDRFLTNEYAISIVNGCNARRWDWSNIHRYKGHLLNLSFVHVIFLQV